MGEIVRQLSDLEQEYRFCDTLDAYKATADQIKRRDKAKYFLVELDLETRRVSLKGFKPAESEEANKEYTQSEQESLFSTTAQRVLVSVSDVEQLKKAYPNYFLDTTEFVARVRDITSGFR